MTKIVTDAHQFYLTAPSPCPYLPGRHERKVFTHLVGPNSAELHDLLTQGGFRRSQGIAYRPACEIVHGLRLRPRLRRRLPPDRQHAAGLEGQSRPHRPLPPGPGDERPVQPFPPLSRQPPFRRRHGPHVGARLRADGGGQPCRQRRRRISPARPGQRDFRARRGRNRGLHADRPSLRRAVDGLFVLRPGSSRSVRSALS